MRKLKLKYTESGVTRYGALEHGRIAFITLTQIYTLNIIKYVKWYYITYWKKGAKNDCYKTYGFKGKAKRLP